MRSPHVLSSGDLQPSSSESVRITVHALHDFTENLNLRWKSDLTSSLSDAIVKIKPFGDLVLWLNFFGNNGGFFVFPSEFL
ncbi:MAG TPA: hypothetical protein DE060_05670 [Lentisphaeria bacterium]|nr:hypothetical protein [Lentisphaeria bacterium]HCG48684.1 hypothetical protein [Lentisphaeria bacterium]